jgi:hypothetical protein
MRADRPKPIVAKTIRVTLSLICCFAADATVTIGDYRTVVECDHRWYMARLVAVTASRDIVVAAGESRRPGC